MTRRSELSALPGAAASSAPADACLGRRPQTTLCLSVDYLRLCHHTCQEQIAQESDDKSEPQLEVRRTVRTQVAGLDGVTCQDDVILRLSTFLKSSTSRLSAHLSPVPQSVPLFSLPSTVRSPRSLAWLRPPPVPLCASRRLPVPLCASRRPSMTPHASRCLLPALGAARWPPAATPLLTGQVQKQDDRPADRRAGRQAGGSRGRQTSQWRPTIPTTAHYNREQHNSTAQHSARQHSAVQHATAARKTDGRGSLQICRTAGDRSTAPDSAVGPFMTEMGSARVLISSADLHFERSVVQSVCVRSGR